MPSRPELADRLRVEPGEPAGLTSRDPADRLGIDKDGARAQVVELVAELNTLHERLWAEATRSVLLVLQGMDTAGKDGAIRRVLSGLNPQGCVVTSFKQPTHTELAHDYLWRAHAAVPPRGRLGVWNRSHYEDVVTVRVAGDAHSLTWKQRFGHICDFERLLADEGTTLVKVFLHLSRDQQRRRLQERVDDPTKRWKFNPGDLVARARWDDHQQAYEAAVTETSTHWAPWYVVPADHKWVRDVAVASLLVSTFEELDPQFPAADPELGGLVIE